MTKLPLSAKQAINVNANSPPTLPYSQAVRTGNTVYLSGCIGHDPATGTLVTGGFDAQAKQVLTNMGSVLEAAGLTYSHVVKTTVLLADINDFAALNKIYTEYFKADPPARSTYQVANLPRGARLEIEAIAVAEAPMSQL